jgi:hypothetical protein
MADELATELIEREQRGDTPFGLYILTPDEPYAELGRRLEREVFFEFFGNTPELLAAEYGPYEDASIFLCVIDHLRARAAGVIRVILPSPAGFKSLHDLTEGWGEPASEILARSNVELTPAATWDVATLAVQQEYRGAASRGVVSLGVYQGLTMLAARVQPNHFIAIMDLVALDLVQKAFYRPFSPFVGCEPRRYLDSPSSLPVYADVPEGWARVEMLDRATYELLHDGVGTEDVISSPLRGADVELDERWFQTA